MRTSHSILVGLTLSVAASCAAAADAPLSEQEHRRRIVEEARTETPPPTALTSNRDGRQFHRQLTGLWHARTLRQAPSGASAWVDLYWIVGRTHAWHVVTLYADEGLQIPLLRWDLIRSYRLEQPSSVFPQAYDLEWTDVSSFLTPYVDSPSLFASIGIADCDLQTGITLDTSDNCGAPLFPFRDCALADFAQLADDRLTFGDPQSTDRCVERANRYEGWTFERATLTPELVHVLLGF